MRMRGARCASIASKGRTAAARLAANGGRRMTVIAPNDVLAMSAIVFSMVWLGFFTDASRIGKIVPGVVVVLSLVAYQYSDAMATEYRAAARSSDAVQARLAAVSGVHSHHLAPTVCACSSRMPFHQRLTRDTGSGGTLFSSFRHVQSTCTQREIAPSGFLTEPP